MQTTILVNLRTTIFKACNLGGLCLPRLPLACCCLSLLLNTGNQSWPLKSASFLLVFPSGAKEPSQLPLGCASCINPDSSTQLPREILRLRGDMQSHAEPEPTSHRQMLLCRIVSFSIHVKEWLSGLSQGLGIDGACSPGEQQQQGNQYHGLPGPQTQTIQTLPFPVLLFCTVFLKQKMITWGAGGLGD